MTAPAAARTRPVEGVAVVTPGGDGDHPWVRAFGSALRAAVPDAVVVDVGVAPAAEPGDMPMETVHYQRSPEAGRRRREAAAAALAGLPAGWRVVQLYTNESVPPGVPYHVFTDTLLATVVAHAAHIPGYVWPAGLLRDALDREYSVLAQARSVLVPSEWLRRWISDHLGASVAAKTRVVGWGPGIDLRQVGRSRLAGPPPCKSPTALFVGNDADRKRLADVVQAFGAARRLVGDLELLVVGPHTVSEPGVTCLGRLDQATDAGRRRLLEAYQRASLFVMPATFEPVGCAYLEAMQAGLPVIARPVCAVPEFVIAGRTGWLVDGPPAITDALVQAAEDPEDVRRRAAEAWTLASERYIWSRVVDRVLEAVRVTEP